MISAQWILTEYLLTAGIVVVIWELAKRSDRLSASAAITMVSFGITVVAAHPFVVDLV